MRRLPMCACFPLVGLTVIACGGKVTAPGDEPSAPAIEESAPETGTKSSTGIDEATAKSPEPHVDPIALPPPPASAPLLELTLDGRGVRLRRPSGTMLVIHDVPRQLSIHAVADELGDWIRSAQVSLYDLPAHAGTFDCTPSSAEPAAVLRYGDFTGFTPTTTDCTITVTYAAPDRVMGTFSANAHPPATSSLAGRATRVEGRFDVPVVEQRI